MKVKELMELLAHTNPEADVRVTGHSLSDEPIVVTNHDTVRFIQGTVTIGDLDAVRSVVVGCYDNVNFATPEGLVYCWDYLDSLPPAPYSED